jgi:hypothetical protein
MPRRSATVAELLPYDVSAITDQLFIAVRPRLRHVEHVRSLGVDLVLSMLWFAPPKELARSPFELVRLPMIDYPLFPLPLWMLRRGVEAALPVLGSGGQGPTSRTGCSMSSWSSAPICWSLRGTPPTPPRESNLGA